MYHSSKTSGCSHTVTAAGKQCTIVLAEVTIMHSGLQRRLIAAIASAIGKSEIRLNKDKRMQNIKEVRRRASLKQEVLL